MRNTPKSKFLTVRYYGEAPGPDAIEQNMMVRTLARGELLKIAVNGTPAKQGAMVIVRFQDGRQGVRRWFRYRGEHFYLSERPGYWAAQGHVVAAAPVVATEVDAKTLLEPGQVPHDERAEAQIVRELAAKLPRLYFIRMHARNMAAKAAA